MSGRSLRAAVAGLALLVLSGCEEFAPQAHDGADFHARILSQEKDGIRVGTAALSGAEAHRYLGVDLESAGIQPIWVEIENPASGSAWYMPIGTDPAYFAPYEVAYHFEHWWTPRRNARIAEHLLTSAVELNVPPGGQVKGFAFVHAGVGPRYNRIQILDDRALHEFHFVNKVPGRKWDFHRIDFDRLYQAAAVKDLELPALMAELEKLPCCAADEKGNPVADPLNVVLVGTPQVAASALVQRGWNFTEPFDAGSAWRSVKAFLLRSPYLTSPVSPLHLFGRAQDVALQKPRNDIDRRNHLRLWLAPFTLRGQPVWVGQVSRDIGVRFTTRSWYLTTHKIDPDVDEDRDYLLQDLVLTEHVGTLALVSGVGEAPRTAPRHNLTGDPYFTDGKRLLVVIDAKPRAMQDIDVIER
ncbi:MAG: LssY C-terminal domain-containing protein [Deltaproteobacteria bacterium]